MPTLGSISGTYGYGRSPQNAPIPGITIYPPIGTKKFWSFGIDGTFAFDANAVSKVGTCYVITPNTSFSVGVKMWGAGGGSGNASVTTATVLNDVAGIGAPAPAGAGGAVVGQLDFQGNQPYTIFVGGAGDYPLSGDFTGQGGAASGILLGNVFMTSSTLTPIAIAGGGGGAYAINDTAYYLAGGGGGSVGGMGTSQSVLGYAPDTNGLTIKPMAQLTTGLSGLPTTTPFYSGGLGSSNNAGIENKAGGGGGGIVGGRWSSGGQGMVSNVQPNLTTVAGSYSVTPYYDDSYRGTAGDSDHGGRVVMYSIEYKVSNITATGGTITTVPIPGYELAYKYHTFTSDDTFVVSYADKTDAIDVFVVGGGGGGVVTGTAAAAGGGGGVAFRSNLTITADSYLVNVGTGGTSGPAQGTGGNYGGTKGKPSAFYTNNLAARGFPNSYVKLINSFGGKIKYINASGDDTDGLTITTGYTSFKSALDKNNLYKNLIVFVVLTGTYNETVNATVADPNTPVYDNGLPRIFVCAPNKVIINWTPGQSTTIRITAPMCSLAHPMSAIYGAIFNRSAYKAADVISSNLTNLGFFNNVYVYDPSVSTQLTAIYSMRGSVFNCVFKEVTGDWGLVGRDIAGTAKFKVENCTFLSASNDVAMTIDGSIQQATGIVLKNCIFQKSLNLTNPTFDNTVQTTTIGLKFVVTSHPDKGVYNGEFGWGQPITTPARTTPLLSIVGHGGGGGTTNVFLGLAQCAGGSGGGTTQLNSRAPSTQYNKETIADYSGYGFPSGILTTALSIGSGGGGAGFPGVGTDGGVGIEFPLNSGIYYGAGGSIGTRLSINSLAPCSVGLGGGSNNGAGPNDFNGTNGIVMVRYVVPGPFTMPTTPITITKNIIAFGGIIRTTSTYKEHVFKSNGTFDVAFAPSTGYFDVILVGGGGGGTSAGIFAGYYGPYAGGGGGGVTYKRFNLTGSRGFPVTIGAGGTGPGGISYSQAVIGGNDGTPTTIGDVGTAYGGAGSGGGNGVGSNGLLITNGLFSDNSTYYGGGGAGWEVNATTQQITSIPGKGGGGGTTLNPGAYGRSSVTGSPGEAYTGGGGGAGAHGGGGAGAGGSGIVIIRYPIF